MLLEVSKGLDGGDAHKETAYVHLAHGLFYVFGMRQFTRNLLKHPRKMEGAPVLKLLRLTLSVFIGIHKGRMG